MTRRCFFITGNLSEGQHRGNAGIQNMNIDSTSARCDCVQSFKGVQVGLLCPTQCPSCHCASALAPHHRKLALLGLDCCCLWDAVRRCGMCRELIALMRPMPSPWTITSYFPSVPSEQSPRMISYTEAAVWHDSEIQF